MGVTYKRPVIAVAGNVVDRIPRTLIHQPVAHETASERVTFIKLTP